MELTLQQRHILEETNLPLLLLLESEALNSDDEPDASKEEAPTNQQEEQPQPDQQEQGQDIPQISDEEQFAMEIDATEDKFLQFVLYDKLGDLASKIDILRDNIKSDRAAEALDLISNLDHYAQYIQVLNELIFSMSTSTIYKILGQIELELIDLLQIYNASLEQKNKEI